MTSHGVGLCTRWGRLLPQAEYQTLSRLDRDILYKRPGSVLLAIYPSWRLTVNDVTLYDTPLRWQAARQVSKALMAPRRG